MTRHQGQHSRLQEWASHCRCFSVASLTLPPLFQARRLPFRPAVPQRRPAPSAPSEEDELLVRTSQSEHGPWRTADSGFPAG
eukprot:8776723-Alexandrium_andersonii.AAC.1